ncbi:Uncharacterised protein [Escherichia coli]|nr:Uncharacterised protein [Escherichia coli]
MWKILSIRKTRNEQAGNRLERSLQRQNAGTESRQHNSPVQPVMPSQVVFSIVDGKLNRFKKPS